METTTIPSIFYWIKTIVSLTGVLVILWGTVIALYQFIFHHWKPNRHFYTIDLIRLQFGRTIILGLEFIIASDLIATTAVPDYYTVGILGALVAIRTLLSFFMNREIASLSHLSSKKV